MAIPLRPCCQLLLVAFVFGGLATAPCDAEVDWHPQRTRVFAVGVLEWQHPDLAWNGLGSASAA